MARSVEQINAYIVDNLVANFAAIGITINPTLWSRRNILRAICYTIAICQALLEQLMDLFTQTVESIQARSAASSTLWIQNEIFKFQYSATVPQVLQFITTTLTAPTGVPFAYSYIAYPIVDKTLRIITACSVKTNVSGQVKIKVAKGNPFVALSSDELAAVKSYCDIKFAAGITYIVTSNDADRLYIKATIWYQGSYSAIIQTSVIDALNNFLQVRSQIDFDGSIKMSDVEGAIRNVPGVNDVVLENVRGRADATAFVDGIDLIALQQVQSRLYNSLAGYVVQEDTSGKTFADTLTFIAQ